MNFVRNGKQARPVSWAQCRVQLLSQAALQDWHQLSFPVWCLEHFWAAVAVSSKSSSCSWLRSSGQGSAPLLGSGFVQTGAKGQLYLGHVCFWWWPGCSALPQGNVRNRVRNGWVFQLFAVSLMSDPSMGVPLLGVLLLFVKLFVFSLGKLKLDVQASVSLAGAKLWVCNKWFIHWAGSELLLCRAALCEGQD